MRVEFETRNQIKQQTRSQRQRQIAQEHEALARSEVQAASNASKAIFHDPRIDQPVEQPSLKQDESCGQKPDVKAITELSKDFKYEGKDKDDKPSRPWETLVIGASLGDNLSRVEYQSRRILQQEFIIEWSKCNEPDSVAFRQQILNDMIQEKEVMEQNDQNHIPA